MGALIHTLNTADRIAGSWRSGEVAALVARDELISRGFYAVIVGERSIVAWLNGVRFDLDGSHPACPTDRAG